MSVLPLIASFVFTLPEYVHLNTWQRFADDHFTAGERFRAAWVADFQTCQNFSQISGERLNPVARTLEEERAGVGPIRKKPGVERSCRASAGASAPERARQEILTPHPYDQRSIKETC
jgi:hypothetical protein